MIEKPLCILHAIDTTGPGGAETVFLDLAEKLNIVGFENYAVIKGSGWVEEQLKRRGVRYYIIKPKGFLSVRYYLALFKLIRENNTQLIHAHLLGSTLTYSILSFFLRIPVIATLHGRVDVNPNERFVVIKNYIMKFGVSRLVAVSNDLANFIAERKLFNKEKIHVIYNGIEESRYQKTAIRTLRESLLIPSDALLVGSLGNVRPAKSYDVLIAVAAKLIKEKQKNIHFVIAGHKKAELMAQLEKLIAEHEITTRIHFIGFHENTSEFLGQLDYFILSSSSEGFSIATIEAMATGLPVVVTRCGGPEEIVEHNMTGFLAHANNPDELADGLLYVVENTDYAQRIATAGKSHATKVFAFSAMLAAYKKVYSHYLL